MKSCDFYKRLSTKNESEEKFVSKYLTHFFSFEEEVKIFSSKINGEKEIKLKEFNFKMLHGILPCNANLSKWKIKQSSECDLCLAPQTIEHLLFDCEHVKKIWNIVNRAFDIDVTFHYILGSCDPSHNEILTLVSFLIYKEWLLSSLENKKRNTYLSLPIFKYEMELRLEIYSMCKSINPRHLTNIEHLLSFM